MTTKTDESTTQEQQPTEEQKQQQAALEQEEGEKGFAAGFKRVAGDEQKDKVDKPDKPDEERPTPEKSAAELQAEAQAKTEAEAKAKADAEKLALEKRWEGVSPMVRERLESLEALPSRLRNIEGHIGGLTTATGRIETALKAAKSAATSTGTPAPSDSQVKAAMADTKRWEELKKDFPDWAEPVEQEFAAIRAELAKAPKGQAVDVKAIRDEVASEVRREIAHELIEDQHPGWLQTVKTPEFRAWMKAQPQDVQQLAASDRPRDARKVLDGYAAHQKSVTDAEAARQRREKRVEGAVTPQGSPQAPSTGISDEEAFGRGFKRVAGSRK